MQYHALSLANLGRRVLLIGYHGERCVPEIEQQPDRIQQVRLSADLIPRPRRRALYLVYAPLKAVLQVLQLLWVLLVTLRRPEVLLVQTPPAIPTLAVAWVLRVLGSTVVIDWHNLAFTIMQQSLSARHPFVPLARRYERLFAGAGDAHLCVTAAMRAWLRAHWGVEARVLHDRPPAFFTPLAPQPRHELLRRLRPQFVDAHGAPLWPAEGEPGSPWEGGGTPWTRVGMGGRVVEREDAPALLISSTSWTADEDFGLLLEALRLLDARLEADAADRSGAARGAPALRVVAVITGKGPLKAHYEEQMRRSPMRRVAVATMWLEPQDYPALLGSASLGVCLHTSSSGLDLPMKVPQRAPAPLRSAQLPIATRLPVPRLRRAFSLPPLAPPAGARHAGLRPPRLRRRLPRAARAHHARAQRPRLRHRRRARRAAPLPPRARRRTRRRAAPAARGRRRLRGDAAALGRELAASRRAAHGARRAEPRAPRAALRATAPRRRGRRVIPRVVR